jgi:translation initiation factor IF-2
MGQTSVLQFASELGLPAELLLEQLKSAGVSKVASSDQLTEGDKTLLLEYLRKEHGGQAPKNKITLTRKQNTEIKKTDSSGKARTIQVEVRKKRVLVRNEEVATPASEVIEAPIIEPVSVEPEIIDVAPAVEEIVASARSD